MPFTLQQLSDISNAELSGDGSVVIDRVNNVDSGEAGGIIFVSNRKYRCHLGNTAASAVIVTRDLVSETDRPALVTDNPRLVFSRIARLLNPLERPEPWISSRAVIAEDVVIDESARIEDFAVIRSGVRLGAGTWIGSGAVLEENAVVGTGTRLHASVMVGHDCSIGNDCILYSGVVIGADGFGLVWNEEEDSYTRVPQLGNVQIGNRVDIGANTAIDRGAIGDTVLEDGVKLDNLIQIGHNVRIGRNTTISASSAIAGSVVIGENCVMGGSVAIADNIAIADRVVLTGRSTVTSSIRQPGIYSSTVAVVEASKWRRILGRLRNLDQLAKRIKALESGES